MARYDKGRIETILSLHFDHGMSYGTIAAAYGMTRGAVAGLIKRHRQREDV